MGNKALVGLVGMLASFVTIACSSDDSSEVLEVRVLAARTYVEVSTSKPGDCSELGEFRAEPGCASDRWRVFPSEACVASSCVRELRLEAGGEVLARVESRRLAAFELSEPYPAGTELVIEGCDAPIRIELPVAKQDVAVSFQPAEAEVKVEVEGEASGLFAKVGSYAFSQGYSAACQSDSVSTTVPISPDFSFYGVTALAFDEPTQVESSRFRALLFPSVYRTAAVSTQVDLGPLWQAAVTVAKESSLYDDCAAACGATTEACDGSPDDTDVCAVSCVGAGEAFPSCVDQYRDRAACAADHVTCGAAPTSGATSPCADEEEAWRSCAE
jgi:hypothetical protein